jgi:hypothetical protein
MHHPYHKLGRRGRIPQNLVVYGLGVVIKNEASGALAGTQRDAVRPDRTRRLRSRSRLLAIATGQVGRSGGIGTFADTGAAEHRPITASDRPYPQARELPPPVPLPRHRRSRATCVSRPTSAASATAPTRKPPPLRIGPPTASRRPPYDPDERAKPAASAPEAGGNPPEEAGRRSRSDMPGRSPSRPFPKPHSLSSSADRRNRARLTRGTAASALSRCLKSIARGRDDFHRKNRSARRFLCIRFRAPHIASTPYPQCHPQLAARGGPRAVRR